MNLNNYQKYTNEINKITNLKIKEIIFDSEIHNWDKNTSEFDSKIFGKEKLLFLTMWLCSIRHGDMSIIGRIEPTFRRDFRQKRHARTSNFLSKNVINSSFSCFIYKYFIEKCYLHQVFFPNYTRIVFYPYIKL